MFKKDTPLAELADEAFEVASRYKNAFLAPDHLLYALCRNPDGREAIETVYEGEVSRILSFLTRSFSDRNTDKVEPSVGDELHRFLAAMIGLDDEDGDEGEDGNPLTVAEILDIMVARCGDFPVLGAALDYGNVVSFDGDEVPIDDEEIERAFEKELEGSPDFSPAQNPAPTDPNAAAMLASLRNLTEMARQGMLYPVVGRKAEVGKVAEILTRHRKPNVLLVGEPGVGKTAIVEGLAQRLATNPPAALGDRPLIEVSMTAMMAGTRYRGDFEARLKHLVDFAIRRRAILFIDEGHSLVGSGSGSGSGGMDAATILKPALARAQISVITATTPAEARVIVKDKALARRFERITVLEPSAEEMLSILSQSRHGYEQHHNVELTREASAEIVTLAKSCIPDRRFPDKAFDVLDQAAIHARRVAATRIEVKHVREAIFEMTGVPVGRPRPAAVAIAKVLEKSLNNDVLGQEEAARELARAVRLSLLGFSKGTGAASAHLFNGPTGVGKTEMAKSLAETLGVPLLRIDMSEYMEKHAVSRLIGAPPGYVGYNDEGVLIGAVEAHPHMVLLLDEVDKAHPEVFDILLQILDAGRVTSGDGRTVSFRGVHLIMTSNLGAREARKPGLGFGAKSGGDDAVQAAVEAHFRPEFIERLSSVMTFNDIDVDIVRKIVAKMLGDICREFEHNDLSVSFTPKVVELIVDQLPKGPLSGRRVKRTIDKLVSDEVASVMMENMDAAGFRITGTGGQLTVTALFPELEA